MTGSNRRPSACKADALPTELILRVWLKFAWQRPIFAHTCTIFGAEVTGLLCSKV